MIRDMSAVEGKMSWFVGSDLTRRAKNVGVSTRAISRATAVPLFGEIVFCMRRAAIRVLQHYFSFFFLFSE